jgi:hypothetical protein
MGTLIAHPHHALSGVDESSKYLPLKDGELLAKGEIFEHQTAARPKPAKHGSEPEPKQVKHGNQGYSRPTLPTALRSC